MLWPVDGLTRGLYKPVICQSAKHSCFQNALALHQHGQVTPIVLCFPKSLGHPGPFVLELGCQKKAMKPWTAQQEWWVGRSLLLWKEGGGGGGGASTGIKGSRRGREKQLGGFFGKGQVGRTPPHPPFCFLPTNNSPPARIVPDQEAGRGVEGAWPAPQLA